MAQDKSSFISKQNIFDDIPDCGSKEICEELASGPDIRLERISSLGQVTRPGAWLAQTGAEWVILLRGRASLLFEGQAESVDMLAGDYVLIPAGARHRVEWTDPAANCVWLALHYREFRKDPEISLDAEASSIENVEIIRTGRRMRTASARVVKDTMYVRVPDNIPAGDLSRIVGELRRKLEKKLLKDRLNSHDDLKQRAGKLNKKYFSGALKFCSIGYVTGQRAKFGCCDTRKRVIRIAHHVASMPVWVREYVIMHELAHLIEPNHGRAFWEIVDKYPLAERAKGFLTAKGFELNDTE